MFFFFFFFQAEDGIRDYKVTGVQTCALPICTRLNFQLPVLFFILTLPSTSSLPYKLASSGPWTFMAATVSGHRWKTTCLAFVFTRAIEIVPLFGSKCLKHSAMSLA